MFNDNGWTVPETYDDLLSLSDKINDAGITPVAMDGGDGWPMAIYLTDLAFRIEGPAVADKINEAVAKGDFTDEVFSDATSLLVKSAKRTEKKGDKMILNTYRAVKFLNLTAKRNTDTLVRLWEIVTDGVCDNPNLSGSKFRTGVVTVGTHQAPEIELLDYCMKQFFDFYNGDNIECPYIKVAIIHFYFVYMHPFCDGNGRIARLITSDFLIHSGLDNFSALTLSKTINETAPDYYQAIENSENSLHDVTPFIQYMLKTVYDNLYEVLEGQGRYIVKHTDWRQVFV